MLIRRETIIERKQKEQQKFQAVLCVENSSERFVDKNWGSFVCSVLRRLVSIVLCVRLLWIFVYSLYCKWQRGNKIVYFGELDIRREKNQLFEIENSFNRILTISFVKFQQMRFICYTFYLSQPNFCYEPSKSYQISGFSVFQPYLPSDSSYLFDCLWFLIPRIPTDCSCAYLIDRIQQQLPLVLSTEYMFEDSSKRSQNRANCFIDRLLDVITYEKCTLHTAHMLWLTPFSMEY